jgi:hypothetical protein
LSDFCHDKLFFYINSKYISIDQSSVIVPKIIGLKFCVMSLDEGGGGKGGEKFVEI